MQDGEGQTESLYDMDLDPNMFSGCEHIIIILTVLLDEDQNIRVLGLALRKLDGNHGDDAKYERVGFLRFYPMHSSSFKTWIADWTQRTITVI